jgi:hypothetical protein
MLRFRTLALLALIGWGLAGPAPLAAGDAPSVADPADQLLPVDCLLPGKIRKLGRHVTYLTSRQALKTIALDCEIRGGEYVSYDRANYETALRVWLPQAEQGDAKAQNYVGEIYERGLGIAPDHSTAASWYRKAAEQGYAPAQINLGQLLEQGLGVAKDLPAALEWYRRASGLSQVNVPYVADMRPAPGTPAREEQARELEHARAEAVRAREEADRARAEQAKASEEGARTLEGSRSDLEQRAKAAAAREEELRARERELERQKQEIERERRELEARKSEPTQRAEAPAPAVPARAELPAPTISLIDPQLPPTRGSDVVRSKAGAGERVIVGRVEAPGGLVLLSVNDAETPVAENGIFQGRVRLGGGETPVSIVAVDQQGKREERKFTLVPETVAGKDAAPPPTASPAPQPARPQIEFGEFYALVIGNDRYERLPHLETATADAQAIAEVLTQRYGFHVTLLQNANRYQILSALNKLRAELTDKDNLLIYYAGHGEIDQANSRGNWLPVDAEPESTANWISNASLTDILNAMAARHVLVVADSCYSGALTRSSLARLERGMTAEARIAWQTQMAKGRSRTALTSGGVAPVLDGGGGKHSVFARALLNVLAKNEDVLEGQRLFTELSALVTWAAEAQRFEQLPEYAPIKFAGHESGDFFFVPRS